MNKYIVGVSTGILIITIIIGIITRQSFEDNISQKPYIDNDEIKVMITHEYNDVYKDYMIKTLSDVESLSDVIVKVSVDESSARDYFSDMTISRVKVEKVYKGDISENEINVIEPIYYWYNDVEGFIMSMDGYYWMRQENEYILFMNELDDLCIGEDDKIYIPTTSLFSKYNVNCSDDLAENAEGYNKLYYKMYKDFWDEVIAEGKYM